MWLKPPITTTSSVVQWTQQNIVVDECGGYPEPCSQSSVPYFVSQLWENWKGDLGGLHMWGGATVKSLGVLVALCVLLDATSSWPCILAPHLTCSKQWMFCDVVTVCMISQWHRITSCVKPSQVFPNLWEKTFGRKVWVRGYISHMYSRCLWSDRTINS